MRLDSAISRKRRVSHSSAKMMPYAPIVGCIMAGLGRFHAILSTSEEQLPSTLQYFVDRDAFLRYIICVPVVRICPELKLGTRFT